MKIFNKIILSMLIVGSAGSVAFGMEDADPSFVETRPSISDCKLGDLSQVILDLDVNRYDQLEKAVAKLSESNTPQGMARILLSRGLNLKSRDKEGCSVLHLAVIHSNLAVAKVLIEAVPEGQRAEFVMAKDSHDSTALHLAAINGPAEMVKILIDAVPSEHRIVFLSMINSYSHTAWDYATMFKRPGVVEMLLEYYKQLGIKVNQ